MEQIKFGVSQANLNQNDKDNKFLNDCIQYLRPSGVGFGFTFITLLTIILFYSLDFLATTIFYLFFQALMFYTVKIKEYNMGIFAETSTFIVTLFCISSNFYIQRTLRSFLIINIQMEN